MVVRWGCRQDPDRLSRREREVAELVARGLNNVEIAAELHISRRTVESHVEHIRQKLNLSSRHQMIAWLLGQSSRDPTVPGMRG